MYQDVIFSTVDFSSPVCTGGFGVAQIEEARKTVNKQKTKTVRFTNE
jgi:hypothetical protein